MGLTSASLAIVTMTAVNTCIALPLSRTGCASEFAITIPWGSASTKSEGRRPAVWKQGGGGHKQNLRVQIDSLLRTLVPVEIKEAGRIVLTGPSVESQQYVHDALLTIASKGTKGKSLVMEALLAVLRDPGSSEEAPVAYRWTTAVEVLGELRATEAIDLLVENLDKTGENDMVSSRNYRPVTHAIAQVGKPAIPGLINALSANSPSIRREAASALAKIGRPALSKLKGALNSADVKTRGGAALALAWIGGREARNAIERAIAKETDPVALEELQDALDEMHRFWGEYQGENRVQD